jgi:hypothetical protein
MAAARQAGRCSAVFRGLPHLGSREAPLHLEMQMGALRSENAHQRLRAVTDWVRAESAFWHLDPNAASSVGSSPDPSRLGSRAAQRVASPWRYVGSQRWGASPCRGELGNNSFPKPGQMMATGVSDRSHDLGRRLLGRQLRPLLAQARLCRVHCSMVAGAFAARLAIGKGCGAPRWASLGLAGPRFCGREQRTSCCSVFRHGA